MTVTNTSPLAVATEVITQWADAIGAVENAALAALKTEMEGLAVLFGGESAQRTPEEDKAVQETAEGGFDNMPI